MLEQTLNPGIRFESPNQPFETGAGTWAKYGSAPSAQEIDEDRREMFQSFAEDF